jgi:Flp pilus assembly protein TadB
VRFLFKTVSKPSWHDGRQGIKKSEAAKRQRDLKKYGKQIQVQKIKQREMEKKSFQDRVQGVKRSRCPLSCAEELKTNAPQRGTRVPNSETNSISALTTETMTSLSEVVHLPEVVAVVAVWRKER